MLKMLLFFVIFTFNVKSYCDDRSGCNIGPNPCYQRGGGSRCLCLDNCTYRFDPKQQKYVCLHNKTSDTIIKTNDKLYCYNYGFNTNTNICKLYDTRCSNGCFYDEMNGICKFKEGVNGINYFYPFCEPIDTLICPQNEYNINVMRYTYCSVNPYSICITDRDHNTFYSGWAIRYPTRLKHKYNISDIKCRFKPDNYCNDKLITRTCCN